MAKPLSTPRWANVSGTIVVPSSGLKDTGWTPGAVPTDGVWNWFNNLTWQWCEWLSVFESTAHTWTAIQSFDTIELLGSMVGAAGTDIQVEQIIATGLLGGNTLQVTGNAQFDTTSVFDGLAEFNGATQFDGSNTFNGATTFAGTATLNNNTTVAGLLSLTHSNPAANTTNVANTLNKAAITKAYVKFTLNASGTPTIAANTAMHITSVTCTSTAITITFASAFANTHFVPHVILGDELGIALSDVRVASQTASTLVLSWRSSVAGGGFGGLIDPTGAGVNGQTFYVSVNGYQ